MCNHFVQHSLCLFCVTTSSIGIYDGGIRGCIRLDIISFFHLFQPIRSFLTRIGPLCFRPNVDKSVVSNRRWSDGIFLHILQYLLCFHCRIPSISFNRSSHGLCQTINQCCECHYIRHGIHITRILCYLDHLIQQCFCL